jgi:hypothetical protein
MKHLIEWLRKRPLLTFLLATGYFFAVSLPHEQVQVFVAWMFSGMTRDSYQAIILGTGIGLFCLYVIVLGWFAVRNQQVKRTLIYGIITLILLVSAVYILVIHNFEMIHFPQYVFLAILIFPLVMRYGETVFWTAALGALDEAYQYFYLAPQRTAYFDFNDIILNLLGAALGVLLIFSCGIRPREYQYKKWYASPVFRISMVVIIGITLLFHTPLLSMYPPADGSSAWAVLVKTRPEGFWEYIPHLHDKFHIVRPLEGLILIVVLLLLYYTMDFPAQRRDDTEAQQRPVK